MGLLLLLVLLVLAIGAAPAWPYSRSWSYFPSGILTIVLIVVLVMLLMGRL